VYRLQRLPAAAKERDDVERLYEVAHEAEDAAAPACEDRAGYPYYYDRANEAARAVRGQLAASELRSLVERERIRYVACATAAVGSLVEVLGKRVLLHAAGDTMTVIEIPPLS
jgi:hypothetical protein